MIKTLKDLDLKDKKVLVRVDFNTPLSDGKVADDSRIRAALPTIKYLIKHNATIILMSHLGRPKGQVKDDYRLEPVAVHLSKLLGKDIRYIQSDGPISPKQIEFANSAPKGSITLLENTRFDAGEKKNDPEMAKILASYADVFVNDAFGTAHRAHASTEGVAHLLPSAAGLLLEKEIEILSKLIQNPEKPFKVIIGGAKVSDKIGVIAKLLPIADEILIGGAMAYSFFKAAGGQVGNSLVEDDKLDLANELIKKASEQNTKIILPIDSACATEIKSDVEVKIYPSEQIPDGWMGLDIGPEAIKTFKNSLKDAKTILWNGPMGVSEVAPFDKGTKAVAETVSELDGFTVIGGGDSVAAINKLGFADKIDHVSTGGGASLELLEGKTLPGVKALEF